MFQSIKKVAFLCLACIFAAASAAVFFSCKSKAQKVREKTYEYNQEQLVKVLNKEDISEETRFAVIKNIAQNMLSQKDYPNLILFLSEWVENHPDDQYNAYWLLVIANAYLEMDSNPLAEYYFERIINNYNDLMITTNSGEKVSVHFMSLQHLVQISQNPANKISYFNQLITRFPDKVKITELYVRLALEYEKEGEWNLALKAFRQFLAQDDASTIRISDLPNAYANAREFVDFYNTSKFWTFETLDDLVAAIKQAISTNNPGLLDNYKSRVNFFNISWRQDENTSNPQATFSAGTYMRGNRVRFSDTLDEISTPTEAYLRTWGWSNSKVWYFYFRKINFPVDPKVHGRWEWAGVYYGDKM